VKKVFLKISIVYVFAALIFSGCAKKLQEHVYSDDTEDNFYTNATQVMAAYGLPYAFLQKVMYEIHFTMSELSTDEVVVTVKANEGYENGQWIRFFQHQWTSQEPFILYEWSNLYQGIGYCNSFIGAMENRDISGFDLPKPKEQLIAEVKMVRAMLYYWLLDQYGNVPVVTSLNTVNPETSPRAEVFAFVEKEIKDNISFLAKKGSSDWYGHFTQSAANALLARLYLNAEVYTGTARWDDCITACNNILEGDESYTLDANWNDPFKIRNENSNENILVVPYDAVNAPGFNAVQVQLWGALGWQWYFNDWLWGKVVTPEAFFNLFGENDLRRNQWLFGPQTYVDENGAMQPVPGWYDQDGKQFEIYPHIAMLNNPTGGYGQGVCNVKYEIQKGTPQEASPTQMSNDLVVFRLGEIMFIKAECLMRKNNGAFTQEAIQLVNDVRARSFAPGDPDAVYTSLTLEEFLDERGREFAYEMKRREDLIRFGKFGDARWEKPADAGRTKELYPIPYNIRLANPGLEQNPGY